MHTHTPGQSTCSTWTTEVVAEEGITDSGIRDSSRGDISQTYIQIHNADGDAGAAARGDYRINFSLIVVAISC